MVLRERHLRTTARNRQEEVEWLSHADICVKYAAMAGGAEYAASLVATARSQPNPLKGGPRLYRVCGRVLESKLEEDRQEKGYEVSAEVTEGGGAEHVRAAMARSLKRLGSDASGGPKPKRRALTDAAPAGSSATAGPSATAGGAATAGAFAAKAGADPARLLKRKQTSLRDKLNTLVFNLREVIAELARVGVTEGYGLQDAVRNLPLLQRLAGELDDILLSKPEKFDDFCLTSSAPIAFGLETLKRARTAVALGSRARAAAMAGVAATAGAAGTAATAGAAKAAGPA